MSDIAYEHPIGKSDHIVLVFNFHGCDISYGSQGSIAAKPLWHKTNFNSLTGFYNSIDWCLDLEDLNFEDSWTKFMSIYGEGCLDMYQLKKVK